MVDAEVDMVENGKPDLACGSTVGIDNRFHAS